MQRLLKYLICLVLPLSSVCAGSGSAPGIAFKLRTGLIWMQVDTAQGGESLNFLLDSGAEASVIDLQTATRLHLDLGQPISVRGISATTGGYWPEHLTARAGGVALPTNYLAMDLAAVSSACHRQVDGLIGADFFAGRVVQIDFAKEKIRLLESCKPVASAEVLPLQIEAARLRVPVAVVGLGNTWARVDTGCASSLHWVVSTNAEIREEGNDELGVGVSSQLIRQHTQSVCLGRLTLKNIPTGLHTEQLLAGEGGLLGTGLLSHFSTVTIDEPAGQLVLEGLVSPSRPSTKFK